MMTSLMNGNWLPVALSRGGMVLSNSRDKRIFSTGCHGESLEVLLVER